MAGSSLLIALTYLLWASAENLPIFYLAATVQGALQAATLYEAAFAVLARRVGAMQARAGVTRITLWGGFASTVFIPFTQTLIEITNWRYALVAMAAVNAVFGLIYWWQIQLRLDAVAPDDAQKDARTTDRAVVSAALRDRVFWLLILSMFCYAAAFSAFSYHMFPMLSEGGLSTGDVVMALAFIGPAQVAGRLVISVMGDRSSIRAIGNVTVAILPPVFLAFYFFRGEVLPVIALCCIYGGANGIFTIVRSLVIPEMVSPKAYGALNGLINFPATLARAIAPWATAVLWTFAHGYGAVILAISATALVMAISFWSAAAMHRRPQAENLSTRQC